jgi:hypothetical protein
MAPAPCPSRTERSSSQTAHSQTCLGSEPIDLCEDQHIRRSDGIFSGSARDHRRAGRLRSPHCNHARRPLARPAARPPGAAQLLIGVGGWPKEEVGTARRGDAEGLTFDDPIRRLQQVNKLERCGLGNRTRQSSCLRIWALSRYLPAGMRSRQRIEGLGDALRSAVAQCCSGLAGWVSSPSTEMVGGATVRIPESERPLPEALGLRVCTTA